VTAVGVRLSEAPDAPSRGEVRIRIPSGQRWYRRWRVAIGDIHSSGDIRNLHAPGSQPGRIAHAAIGWMLAGTGMAERITAGLADQDGRYGWNRTALSGKRLPLGDLASWKDPL